MHWPDSFRLGWEGFPETSGVWVCVQPQPRPVFWYGSRTTDRGIGWVWEREQRSKRGREMEQAERELDALILEVTMDAVMFVRGCLTILDYV